MTSKDVLEDSQSRWLTGMAQWFPGQKERAEADAFDFPGRGRFIELSEGELVMPPDPSFPHQRVVGRVYNQFDAFVGVHDLGLVRFAPLPVRLWPDKIREPDILFVTHQRGDRIGEQASARPTRWWK